MLRTGWGRTAKQYEGAPSGAKKLPRNNDNPTAVGIVPAFVRFKACFIRFPCGRVRFLCVVSLLWRGRHARVYLIHTAVASKTDRKRSE